MNSLYSIVMQMNEKIKTHIQELTHQYAKIPCFQKIW